jgi:hypothetical protein
MKTENGLKGPQMEIPNLPDWFDKATGKIKIYIAHLRKTAFFWQHEAEDLRAALAELHGKLTTSFYYFLPNECEMIEPHPLPDDITLYIRVAEGTASFRIYKPTDAPHKIVVQCDTYAMQVCPINSKMIEIVPDRKR